MTSQGDSPDIDIGFITVLARAFVGHYVVHMLKSTHHWCGVV
jgi:hypothetical protein